MIFLFDLLGFPVLLCCLGLLIWVLALLLVLWFIYCHCNCVVYLLIVSFVWLLVGLLCFLLF